LKRVKAATRARERERRRREGADRTMVDGDNV
jgi:hypothetical protein